MSIPIHLYRDIKWRFSLLILSMRSILTILRKLFCSKANDAWKHTKMVPILKNKKTEQIHAKNLIWTARSTVGSATAYFWHIWGLMNQKKEAIKKRIQYFSKLVLTPRCLLRNVNYFRNHYWPFFFSSKNAFFSPWNLLWTIFT